MMKMMRMTYVDAEHALKQIGERESALAAEVPHKGDQLERSFKLWEVQFRRWTPSHVVVVMTEIKENSDD